MMKSDADRDHNERMRQDSGDLYDLVAWLEYAETTGYRAARQTDKQDRHWAKLLRELLDPEPCCECGRPSVRDYQDREDCPSCGQAACELSMQRGIDYCAEAGDR